MELVMEAQDDATPWPVGVGLAGEKSVVLQGRGSFAELGIVRRKPGMKFKAQHHFRPVLMEDSAGRQSANPVQVMLG